MASAEVFGQSSYEVGRLRTRRRVGMDMMTLPKTRPVSAKVRPAQITKTASANGLVGTPALRSGEEFRLNVASGDDYERIR